LLDAGADPNVVGRHGKSAGDNFETVFVNEEDANAIKEALTAAREALNNPEQQQAQQQEQQQQEEA
jgi:hypothetical protein